MTHAQLIRLTTTPLVARFKRFILRAELATMALAADYYAAQERHGRAGAAGADAKHAKHFAEQEARGRSGLLWAHRQQAIINSALNCMP